MIYIPDGNLKGILENGPIKPNQNSSNAISISSKAPSITNNGQVPTNSLTPWSDANWEQLKTTDQGEQNAWNIKNAEYMRNTSLTSYVNQLKENGLNPILAMQNFGSSGSSSANFSNSSKESENRNVSSILSSALAVLGMIIAKS